MMVLFAMAGNAIVMFAAAMIVGAGGTLGVKLMLKFTSKMK
jgi:hypothetical protein